MLKRAKALLTQHSKVAWKLYFVVQLLVVIAVAHYLTLVLRDGGESYSDFHNTYCQTNPQDCANDFKFNKIIFMWCDGVSFDISSPIADLFSQNIFKIKHREVPWSAWVFSTIMTGKSNRNVGQVKNDNLVYQFFLNGMKSYIGVDKGNKAFVFDQLDLKYNKGDIVKYYPGVGEDQSRMFEWLFNCEKSTPECVNDTLGKAKAEQRSVFTESLFLDHITHEEQSRFGPNTQAALNKLVEGLVSVKQWVDNNPEYLLVLVSDHGHKRNASNVLIHGDWTEEGNEGWLMMYNPTINTTISTTSHPIKLRTVDVAPTISQFFSASGVSIPAESVGKVYPITITAATMYKTLKVNAIQIRALLKKEKLFHYPEESWREALSAADEGNYERAVVLLDEYISGFADRMYELRPGVAVWSLFAALLFLAITLVLQFGNFATFKAMLSSVGFGIMASSYITWIIYVVFFTQPSNADAVRLQVFIYVIPLCGFLVIYYAKKLKRAEEKQPAVQFALLKADEEADLDDKPEEDIIIKEKSMPRDIYDNWREKNYAGAISTLVNYIIGNKRMQLKSIEHRFLTFFVLFATFSCMQTAFSSRGFIIENIGSFHKREFYWMLLALLTLWLEFRQQRILLTTYLDVNTSPLSLRQSLFHTSFIPLNLKMVLYFILLFTAFNPSHGGAFFVYTITLIHIVLLLFCPAYIQRDLVLPIFVLTFMLSTSLEKVAICYLMNVLHQISAVFETLPRSSPAPHKQHFLPFLVVILMSLAHFFFSVVCELPYQLDQINLQVAGIDNITQYPMFSVAMIGVHFCSIFLLIIPFLIRTLTPTPPPLVPLRLGKFSLGHMPSPKQLSEHSGVSYKPIMTSFLTMGLTFALFLYTVNSLTKVSDIPLIWTFFLFLVTFGYSLSVVLSELIAGLCTLVNILVRCENADRQWVSKWWNKA